ncbi:uncharacterized protein IL334_001450 [Kwoniella shivajii]|uniref:F-box domain-containing protein n=1 Tax=Kwoniella shivajii TaxID=564305 RepID=A0ABZ1CS48_9TREE|nr:hypothetical protein IL334_001450 [Kwoniella shivajii]
MPSKKTMFTFVHETTAPISHSSSLSTTFFSRFPPEIASVIFSYMDHQPPPDKLNLILTSRTMYSRFLPSLYRRLCLRRGNVGRILDSKFQPKLSHQLTAFHGHSRRTKIGHGRLNSRKDDVSSSDEDHDQSVSESRTVEEVDLRTGAIGKLKRKFDKLKHVNSLIVVDWKAAKSIASYITLFNEVCEKFPEQKGDNRKHEKVDGDLVDEEDKDKLYPRDKNTLFPNLQTLSYGISFLQSNEFYPSCTCDSIPPSNDVLEALSTLTPKHICANWYPSIKHHHDDPGLEDNMNNLIGDRDLESFTWHGIRSSTSLPDFAGRSSVTRVFCSDCGEEDVEEEIDVSGESYYGLGCRCKARLKEASLLARVVYGMRNDMAQVEVINLTCLGDIGKERIEIDGRLLDVGETKQQIVQVYKGGQKTKYELNIWVTSKEQARPCICCGEM